MSSLCKSERVSELIGAILGDGNIYDRRPTYVELCGNPVNDSDYFKSVLLPIVKAELHLSPKLFIRSRGLRFRINNKSFVDWLKRMGIPSGELKAKARIPSFIAENRRLLVSCIRGIYDTDGSVYFDARATYRKPYPRIDLHMRNRELLNQLTVLLTDFGIVHSFVRSKGSLETSGVDVLKQFLEKIGFSNSYHIQRIRSQYPEMVKFNSSPKLRSDNLKFSKAHAA